MAMKNDNSRAFRNFRRQDTIENSKRPLGQAVLLKTHAPLSGPIRHVFDGVGQKRLRVRVFLNPVKVILAVEPIQHVTVGTNLKTIN